MFRFNNFPTIRSAGLAICLAMLLVPRDASTAAANSALEQRMLVIEDQRAIEALLLEYGRTLDNRDFAAYARLFAKDGEWKGALGTFRGPGAIQAAMERSFNSAAALADIPKGSNFHVMSNFSINVQGDRATASSMFIFYKMEKNIPVAAVAGRYEDLLVRENGVWRFQQRSALPPG